ncbi:hypothetical protein PENSUB_1926 [Penicillium subrubescens]|uniref:Uncharacterized protein n=1 Tax=Penicillium subrubescens TaxID=1316194 RepID=A0A1Q5UJ01_9EURO|nr:hypothetical protein PENSUB_1926 [Penicillium subrubescens]
MENVEQILLPRCITDQDNRLPFRKLKAELYKLNNPQVGRFHPASLYPQKFSLYGIVHDLVSHPGFMKHGKAPHWELNGKPIVTGGVFGMYCSHAYPHASREAQHLLPTALKVPIWWCTRS